MRTIYWRHRYLKVTGGDEDDGNGDGGATAIIKLDHVSDSDHGEEGKKVKDARILTTNLTGGSASPGAACSGRNR